MNSLKASFLLAFILLISGFAKAAQLQSIGQISAAVVLVNFSDNPVQPKTPAYIQNIFYNDVNNYFKEASLNKLSILSGSTHGWYTIPVTSNNCDTSLIAQEGRTAAAANGVDLSSFQLIVFMFPTNSGCGFSGVGGSSPTGQSYIFIHDTAGMSTKVIAHEMGHAMGLMHSDALNCGATCIGTEGVNCTRVGYGDPADLMGTRMGHMNAFIKESLGWINSGGAPSITHVQASGNYRIGTYELNNSDAKALKILKSTNSTTGKNTYYYVEYRQPVGFDLGLANVINSNLTQGVLVHQAEENNLLSSLFLDMTPNSVVDTTRTADFEDGALGVGKTYVDSVAGVSIKLVSMDANGANIEVTLTLQPPPPANDTVLPSVAITSPYDGQIISASSTLMISANASDNVGVTKVEFRVNGSLKCTDTIAPYTCSYAVPRGGGKSYLIEAKAYDAAGNFSVSLSNVITAGGGTKSRK